MDVCLFFGGGGGGFLGFDFFKKCFIVLFAKSLGV